MPVLMNRQLEANMKLWEDAKRALGTAQQNAGHLGAGASPSSLVPMEQPPVSHLDRMPPDAITEGCAMRIQQKRSEILLLEGKVC